MTTQELIFYIKEQLKGGIPPDVVKEVLITRGGWRAADIDEAFAFIGLGVGKKPAPQPKPVAPSPVAQSVRIEPQRVELTAPTPKVEPPVEPKPVAPPAPTPLANPAPVTPPPPVQQELQSQTSPTPIASAPTEAPTESVYEPTHKGMAPEYIGMSGTVVSETPVKKHTGKKSLMLVFIILGVLLLGGAGAYAYMYYINPSSDRVFATMTAKLEDAKSFEYKEEAIITVPSIPSLSALSAGAGENTALPASSNQTITFSVEGAVDSTDPNRPMSQSTIHLETTLLPFNLSVLTEVIGDKIYFQLPNLGILTSAIAPDVAPGDWLYLSKADLEKMALENPEFKSRIENFKQNQLTEEERQAIKKAFIESGTFVPTLELPRGATPDGVPVRKYQWTVDKDKLLVLIENVSRIATGEDLTAEEKTELAQGLGNIEITDGEIWIGVRDFLPHEVHFTMKVKDANFPVTVKNTFTLSNFGKKLNLTEPENATSYYDIFSTAQSKSKDAEIKAWLGSARALGEIYYSTVHSYLGVCTSPNGFVETVRNVGVAIAPDTANCIDSKGAYRLYAHLVTDPTKFFCVDSAANALELTTLPQEGFVCK